MIKYRVFYKAVHFMPGDPSKTHESLSFVNVATCCLDASELARTVFDLVFIALEDRKNLKGLSLIKFEKL